MTSRGQKRPRSISFASNHFDTKPRDLEWKRSKTNLSSFADHTKATFTSPATAHNSYNNKNNRINAPATITDEFRIKKVLSNTRLTMVCKSVLRETGEVVVTKTVFKDSNRRSFRAIRLLRKEALAMASLKGHKRIIPLLRVIEDDEKLCLVMKYAEGGDLYEYIKARGSLSKEDSYRIFGQLVEGLSYAHSRGFIHRDIKPGWLFTFLKRKPPPLRFN